MAIYPGAIYQPTPHGGRTPRRKQGRGILHVAVSGRKSLPPWNGNTWHMYVAKDGTAYQYVDSEYCAWASLDANDDAFSIETEGGLGSSANVNAEPWTVAQCVTIANIMRWQRDVDGVPLDLLPDSKPGRRGWGPHRLGIDPWRVPGGERWSSVRGKECPGNYKISQIPGILELARGGSLPAPVAPAPPAPIVVPPRSTPFPLPRDEYFGDISGPADSHGGFYAHERPYVKLIQQCLQEAGFAPKAAGWADGIWEPPTTSAMAAYQRAHLPGTTRFGECWWDDWAALVNGLGNVPSPPPPPAPAPARDTGPQLPPWGLPAGHYYGPASGPAESHGGGIRGPRGDAERSVVRLIQQRLIFKGCVPGIQPSAWASSRWADGIWEDPTTDAVVRWHRRYYPNQPFMGRVYADDYARLARA